MYTESRAKSLDGIILHHAYYAEGTTVADGNTWNHEHIGMLGLCLTSPVDEAHAIARHLADYILVWIGGGSDDLGKSTHMARISNSVYKGTVARILYHTMLFRPNHLET